MKNNILLINKPPGPTSHDIVDEVRKITGKKRVGHAGALDPFAEGLLIVLVGREATRLQASFMKMDKEYIATLHLGAESSTGDATGALMPIDASEKNRTNHLIYNCYDRNNCIQIPQHRIEKAIAKNFISEIEQVPPEYSAIKISGRKAYELARKGKKVKLKPRKITIYSIEILSYEWPLLTLRINCSSGTYIRALARDIGRKLECGAYVEKLVRTKVGEYKLEEAINLENLKLQNNIKPLLY